MKVRDVMRTDLVLVQKSSTYKEVAKILYDRKISGAPVVDETGRLVGVISEKDLFKVLYPYYKTFYATPQDYADLENRENKAQEVQDHSIEGYMTKDVVTIAPDEPIMSAGATMLARHVHRLPVVENGKLIGMVSRKSIYRAILQQKFGF